MLGGTPIFTVAIWLPMSRMYPANGRTHLSLLLVISEVLRKACAAQERTWATSTRQVEPEQQARTKTNLSGKQVMSTKAC
eukprot:826937-Amphidinium_carterae.1